MRKIHFFCIFILLLFGTIMQSARASDDKITVANSLLSLKEITLTVGDQKETVSGDQFKNWIAIEPALRIRPGNRSEIENILYCPFEPLLCRLTFSIHYMSYIKKETSVTIDKEKVQEFINTLTHKFDREPVDAKFKIEDIGVSTFTPSQNGLKIDANKSAEILSEALLDENIVNDNSEINLAFENLEPEIKSSDVNDLGINTLIGEGKSNFRGSPKNRIFNINVGTEKFNGVLIKPGEEFSFVKTLGPVDGEHGYAPELVIKQDKTEPEFGGGICQVSTTAFRAAINSGLKITARRNHAYPVVYYNPQGMDATVYIPKPDLQFVNNTPNYILIQTKIEGTILTFQFYGTDDGRKVEITGPTVYDKKPDGSMKATFTQKTYNKDGDVMINDVFKSNYESPSKFPHPGEEKLTKKPKGWSDKEWKKYKQTNGI